MLSCRKTHEPAHKADYIKAQKTRDHFYDVDVFDAFRKKYAEDYIYYLK